MGSIQAKGKGMVLKMYNNRDVEAWSIWQGKQFLFKGIGEAELETIIDALVEGESNSMYTLKVYEDITNVKDIKGKTPEDGSFNFVVTDHDYLGTRRNDTQDSKKTIGTIEQRIYDRVEQQMIALMEKGEEEPPEETIGDILQQPEKIKAYVEAIAMIKNIFSSGAAKPLQQPQMQLGHVGNSTRITEDAPQEASMDHTVENNYTEEDYQRIAKAVDTLGANDPKIVEHLEKLAAMSVNNKSQFNNMLSMLDLIK